MHRSGSFRRFCCSMAALMLLQFVPLSHNNARAAEDCADVALVLALDGSSSVDDREYRFQQQAVAAALRDSDVLAAMAAAGTVTVTVIFWGDAKRPVHHAGTATIRVAADGWRLARFLEGEARRTRGTTGLGAGLAAALDELDSLGCAHHAVINVTGDGPETVLMRGRQPGPRLHKVRERADAQGVTINALVISGAAPELGRYYAGKVITGADAFVMEVADYADFAAALKKKLIREIAPVMISRTE